MQISAHISYDTMDQSQKNSSNVKSYQVDSLRRFSLHHIRHRSFSTITANESNSIEGGCVYPYGSVQGIPQHQSIGLRTKKYIIPRLLSNRKIALSVLHPLSAALMNDIHYLLKAHIAPKPRFQMIDHVILRTLIKVGIVSQCLLEQPNAVVLMRRVERLSRKFGLLYCDIVTQADEVFTPPVSSSSSASPAKSPSPDLTLLLSALEKLQDSLNSLIQGQLSEKSINYMDVVFEELQDPLLWQHIFDRSNSTPEEWQLVLNLRHSFKNIIDANLL